MDSALRPRDIQARIRAGESPEAVADAAGTSVDRIMGYATPVLAERGYVAQQAQRASVRRRAGAGPVGQLGEALAQHVRGLDIDPESVEWDSWRRPDGRWTVVADYGVGASAARATFAYDVAGRYVVAEDDESRTVVGERTGSGRSRSEDAGSGDAEPGGRSSGRAADRTGAGTGRTTPGEQTSLGDDAIEVVTGRRPEPAEPGVFTGADEVTVDLTDTAAGLRSPAPGTGDADWMVTQASERPRGGRRDERSAPRAGVDSAGVDSAGVAETAGAEEQQALFAAPSGGSDPSGGSGAPAPDEAAAPGPQDPVSQAAETREPGADASATSAPATASRPTEGSAAPAPAAEGEEGSPPADLEAGPPAESPSAPAADLGARRPKKQTRGKGRASVPTWDEIMFGSDRRD